MGNKQFYAAFTLVAVTFVIMVLISSLLKYSNATNAAATTTIKIHAGGGNSTDMLATFVPQLVQIKVGQTVSWDNPSTVGEPHTVTFILNEKTMTGIIVPFAVPNSTKFMPLPPGANSQPKITLGTNGMNIVSVSNARSYYPTIVGSGGDVKISGPNANFTMSGNEQYVNSGYLLPKQAQQSYPGSSNIFSMTFQKPGTFSYLCLIHPWMTGVVVVK
jgi:plastocyanin